MSAQQVKNIITVLKITNKSFNGMVCVVRDLGVKLYLIVLKKKISPKWSEGYLCPIINPNTRDFYYIMKCR